MMGAAATVLRLRRALHPRHVRVIAVTVVVEIGLRTTRLPRLARLLHVRLDVDGHDVDGQAVQDGISLDPSVMLGIRRYGRATDRVLRRWPFGDTCLRRALILGCLIRSLDPILCIGVRRDDAGEIAAHAWLVVAGATLDPTAARYLPFGDVAR